MKRSAYLIAGLTSLMLGALGILLPILPTVPFVLLAAFCFGRSSPGLERRLVEHAKFGPHIEAWRKSRAISRTGKRAAYVTFAVSAVCGIVMLQWPTALVPVGAAGKVGRLSANKFGHKGPVAPGECDPLTARKITD